MSTIRFKAIERALTRPHVKVTPPSKVISDYFGINVFDDAAMRKYLSNVVFQQLKDTIKQGKSIAPSIADSVAAGMKSWAMERGVTHYSHWFQPLTGGTAEKHDAFFDIQSDGTVIEKFKGSALSQQEPDASSFPNGGIRSTFEARGYTGWDASSPAFIMEINGSNTLCIPTIFVSYTGEALDYKMPLLKALHAIDNAATDVCKYFYSNTEHVMATLGAEQEYFLVDKALYFARPDLLATGRTVFGHKPPKGQQLDDHYFGSIPSRARSYMIEFEIECLKLGIPIRTRHNEVAPSQFECASTFEECNLAVDHNLLLMEVMEKVAEKHHFNVLFHEKPFEEINGSGKHNNWSLMTNTGTNLLAPSTKAKENLRFLTFLINTIKAVHDHADLLRSSIMSAGNEHRLGANEAPPAIISVFIGSQLTSVLEELEQKSNIKLDKGENLYMKTGISKIPPLLLDNTDRNRTSPFAFTGNKFEFRAVGSADNCAANMTVLNTIVANQLIEFKKDVDQRIQDGEKKEVAIVNVLKEYIKSSKGILFEGDGYSDEWVKEANKRGLSNQPSCVDALDALLTESSIALFEKMEVLTQREVEARHDILLENYLKKIQIESRIIGELCFNTIIPTAIAYQNKLVEYVKNLKNIGLEDDTFESTMITIKKIAEHINTVQSLSKKMIDERKKANKMEDTTKKAKTYTQKVKPFFDKIRRSVDKLELIISDESWPLAKYRELLFMR